jgi:hypothetical protein
MLVEGLWRQATHNDRLNPEPLVGEPTYITESNWPQRLSRLLRIPLVSSITSDISEFKNHKERRWTNAGREAGARTTNAPEALSPLAGSRLRASGWSKTSKRSIVLPRSPTRRYSQ